MSKPEYWIRIEGAYERRMQRTITTLIAAIGALNANDKRLLDIILKTNGRIQKLESQNKMNRG